MAHRADFDAIFDGCVRSDDAAQQKEHLRDSFEETRRKGYLAGPSSIRRGVAAIAAPALVRDRPPTVAIGVTGPMATLKAERYEEVGAQTLLASSRIAEVMLKSPHNIY